MLALGLGDDKMTFKKFKEKIAGLYPVEANKLLVCRYPFLLPRNVWTGKKVEDYDFSFTNLDSLDKGWRTAFGLLLCENVRKILLKAHYLKKYRITQIKEKYGTLCWYDNGVPVAIADEFRAMIRKFEDISALTCIECGQPADNITRGYIMPLCAACTEARILTWGQDPVAESDKNTRKALMQEVEL